jgi:hypothetical protein
MVVSKRESNASARAVEHQLCGPSSGAAAAGGGNFIRKSVIAG